MIKTECAGQWNGRPVQAFTLQNGPLRARLLEYGATLQNLWYNNIDCVAGYDTLAGYIGGGSYQGATVGRYANRIAGAAFSLGDKRITLTANEGATCLHGGAAGFSHRLFAGRPAGENAVRFSLASPDGDGGFPGNLQVSVTVSLAPDGITFTYEAVCDADTVVNLTNHSYFTLGAARVEDLVAQVAADAYLPVDEALIPLGDPAPVDGTPFDWRRPVALQTALAACHPQLTRCGGFDHNFVLGYDRRPRQAAVVYCPQTDLALTCHTDLPGLQVYTANMLNEPAGKGGRPLAPRTALCLETQFFPNTPNRPDFPSCFLPAGQPFRSVTRYGLAPGDPF